MTPDTPRDDNCTRCFRAASIAERDDILVSGVLRPGFNTLEGKWFADSLEGAVAHGKSLYPDGSFSIIVVDIPNDAPSLSTRANLDGFGPARFLHADDLPALRPRIMTELQ